MKRTSHRMAFAIAAGACLVGAPMAFAHPAPLAPGHGALMAGALHPLGGADHLLAMLASGLLAVRVGTKRALWLVPASFIALMLVGGAIALLGVPLPHVEWAISLSVIVLGLMVAMLPKVPLSVAAGWVAIFAIAHGHAHVAELAGQSVLPYMIGFTMTTLALHLAAIGGGVMALRARRPQLVRFAGASIAMAFAVVLVMA